MSSDWKDLFLFTRREKGGILVLLFLIFLVGAYYFCLPYIYPSREINIKIPEKWVHHDEQQDSLIISQESSSERTTPLKRTPPKERKQDSIFYFNPNGLSREDWIKLGLSPAQAESVKRFESKGGVFRVKEDVKKLYVISPEKYTELEPFIELPEKSNDVHAVRRARPAIVELNTADTSDLVALPGIGPVLARRIVAYRERLGGFYDPVQLLEVYGLQEEAYQGMSNQVKADSTMIRKLNVNTAEISDLKTHPYLDHNKASAIINYRRVHGPYKELTDIMKCRLVGADLYRKIAPYLTL